MLSHLSRGIVSATLSNGTHYLAETKETHVDIEPCTKIQYIDPVRDLTPNVWFEGITLIIRSRDDMYYGRYETRVQIKLR